MKLLPLTAPKMDLEKYNPERVPAINQVRIMEDSAFEDFIGEWLYTSKRSQYKKIQLVGGAGDKGRDAVCTCFDGKLDYYQCKHYNKGLTPSEYTVELGKLCYYTFTGEYPIPQNYYIVASNDIGPRLKDLLDSPALLRDEVINNWGDRCEGKISHKKIPLIPKLKDYIENFDFSIVKHYPIQQVIDEHLPSVYGSLRFGTATVKRPENMEVPSGLDEDELKYITALLKVYSEAEKHSILNIEELKKYKKWSEHLDRQRKDYYSTETIRRGVRDLFTGNGEFVVFEDEIFDGIIDTYEDDYESGIKRLRAVLNQAAHVSVQKSLLSSKLNWIGSGEKKGMCHMLINDDKLEGWIHEK